MIKEVKFQRYILLIAVIVYTLTAFFSVGYFHADEHYQIIEFAGLLDGTNEPSNLPWEYRSQIRSTIQPIIAFLIFKVCNSLSILDPYLKALVLRLITVLLSISIVYYFSNACKKIVSPQKWKLFLVLTYFLWFLPFINVRFSSETWSGLLLLLSVAIIIKGYNNYKAYTLLGCILGLSFLFRYQIAFSFFGILLWLIFIRKEFIYKIGISLLSFLIVLLIGFFIDSWYYGEWTITTLNYFTVNLIEGRAALFGTSPWYHYFSLIFLYSFFPIGIIILLSIITVGITKHKNIIPWIIIPFFVGHSLVSHKELRFLFPLINFIPIIIIMSLDYFSTKNWNILSKSSAKTFFIVLFLINAIGLIFISARPAGDGRVKITEKIHTLNDKEHLNVFFTTAYNPLTHSGLSTNFYKEENVNFINLNSSAKLNVLNSRNKNTRNVLVITISDLQNEKVQLLINTMLMKEVGKSLPGFLLPLLKKYGKEHKILILYSD